AVGANGRGPVHLPVGEGAEEVKLLVALAVTVHEHLVHEQLAWGVSTVALVVGGLGEEVAPAVGEAEVGGHGATAELQLVEEQVSEAGRLPRDLVVEPAGVGVTGYGAPLPTLPSRPLDLVEAREHRGVRLGEVPRPEGALRL